MVSGDRNQLTKTPVTQEVARHTHRLKAEVRPDRVSTMAYYKLIDSKTLAMGASSGIASPLWSRAREPVPGKWKT